MQTYLLRITPWRDPRCSRSIEFLGSHSLGDVHAAIQTEFELDDDHLWAFYLSGDLSDRESEFAPEEVGRSRSAWDAELRSLDLAPGMRFRYRFDFGAELIHEIEVVELGDPTHGAKYPRVVARTGTPPPQYPGVDDDHEEQGARASTGEPPAEAMPPAPVPPALLDQVRPALDRTPLLGPDEVRLPEVQALLTEAAGAMLEACPTPEALDGLSHAVGEYVPEWLTWVVRTLSHAGQAEAAFRIADQLATITGKPADDELAAEALQQQGRLDEALARLAEVHYGDPNDMNRLHVRIARVHAEKGDHAAAEAELRDLLAQRWVSGHVRDEAVPLLAEVLRATGRAHEATVLEDERRRQVAAAHPEIPHTVRRDAPKIGRNDPCPCGSGKKYKKCCGR